MVNKSAFVLYANTISCLAVKLKIEIGKDSPREANMIFHVGGNSTNELYSIYKLLTKIPHVYILLTKTVLTVWQPLRNNHMLNNKHKIGEVSSSRKVTASPPHWFANGGVPLY